MDLSSVWPSVRAVGLPLQERRKEPAVSNQKVVVLNAAKMNYDGLLDFSVLSPDTVVYEDSAPEEILERIQGAAAVVTKELPVPPEMIAQVEQWLKAVKDNVYSFETDAGKADMITGKVAVNYQWSGDGVYTMDQADEDDFTLAFAVPEESTDIYFDGWVMLKKGIEQDSRKQHAAEAFINYLSRPDNTIRNMYYIGYTSVLSGGDDPRLFEYAQYNYEAEDEEEETVDYDLGYFFADPAKESAAAGSQGDGKSDADKKSDGNGEGNAEDKAEEDGAYIISVPADQVDRQISAAYPPEDVIRRSSIMVYFNDDQNAQINRMWTNVRCYDIRRAPVWGWLLIAAALAAVIRILIKKQDL